MHFTTVHIASRGAPLLLLQYIHVCNLAPLLLLQYIHACNLFTAIFCKVKHTQIGTYIISLATRRHAVEVKGQVNIMNIQTKYSGSQL